MKAHVRYFKENYDKKGWFLTQKEQASMKSLSSGLVPFVNLTGSNEESLPHFPTSCSRTASPKDSPGPSSQSQQYAMVLWKSQVGEDLAKQPIADDDDWSKDHPVPWADIITPAAGAHPRPSQPHNTLHQQHCHCPSPRCCSSSPPLHTAYCSPPCASSSHRVPSPCVPCQSHSPSQHPCSPYPH